MAIWFTWCLTPNTHRRRRHGSAVCIGLHTSTQFTTIGYLASVSTSLNKFANSEVGQSGNWPIATQRPIETHPSAVVAQFTIYCAVWQCDKWRHDVIVVKVINIDPNSPVHPVKLLLVSLIPDCPPNPLAVVLRELRIVFTPPTPMRLNSTIASRRRRQCVLALSVIFRCHVVHDPEVMDNLSYQFRLWGVQLQPTRHAAVPQITDGRPALTGDVYLIAGNGSVQLLVPSEDGNLLKPMFWGMSKCATSYRHVGDQKLWNLSHDLLDGVLQTEA